jgi:hypothetical protein
MLVSHRKNVCLPQEERGVHHMRIVLLLLGTRLGDTIEGFVDVPQEERGDTTGGMQV